MAAAKGKASPDEGEAAAPKPKSVKFRGLTLKLEPQLPNTLLFDIIEEEAGDNVFPAFRMLRDIVGPEQFTAIRNAVKADDDIGELLSGLLDDILGQYGIDLGK